MEQQATSWNLWKDLVINPFLKSDKGKEIASKVSEARKNINIFPASNEIFDAFYFTPINDIKIVLIGLDPYNKGNHAHGLSFSSKQMNTPPSLRVIFKELKRDLFSYMTEKQWKQFFPGNNLTNWAEKGMLLLNRYLTVEEGKAKSHANLGWDIFTRDYVFKYLNDYPKPLVFILWGKDAQEVEPWITNKSHLILNGAHPAADLYNPTEPKFAGCSHFSQAIKFLHQHREEDCKEIIIDIEKYFKSEMFSDIKKMVQGECYPYIFKDDNDLAEHLKSSLKLSYNYGFDFTLIK